MGKAEQKEEREVLDSIFPDEITDVSETEYRVSIALDVPDVEEDERPVIILKIQYPAEYPDVAPELDISAPHNAAKHAHLDVQEDKARLLESLRDTVEESVGMAMVFTLINTLKDSAELLISERLQSIQALKEVEAAKAEEEENKKFHGTAVNKEVFLDWRARYRQELQEEELKKQEEKEVEDKKKRVVKEAKKMTGRELWEKGLAGKISEEDEEEGLDDISGMTLTAHDGELEK